MNIDAILQNASDGQGWDHFDQRNMLLDFVDELIRRGVICQNDLEKYLYDRALGSEAEDMEDDISPERRAQLVPKTRRRSVPANEAAGTSCDIMYIYDYERADSGLDPWCEVVDMVKEPKAGRIGFDVDNGLGHTFTIWLLPDELVYYE